ncbi:MAG: branched-chain amino acid ABC transporter permease [Gammaproteobacteria bacterium]|nr:branched-chain amino acid ABC transporter permease [Gammaproteobacteria bacterium]NIR88864.1 branched-chain amino acid ABC transporter permease [Gammaproteobacteria bacterium]NIU06468.1 branched-chain amino acid ABC transporter permease [Gammaproteobacteria bacterium]NIV53360.1 branched-chain amino acid ABC transporter permease [Gammaproteobacteria bacterium]NIV74079.1 branched-chain amino acid ABC transporter permease [Gammaproteobacteria bacterium]
MFELQQFFVSGIVIASIWALPAAGVSLIYGVLRFPNFAIAEFVTLGAYLAFSFSALGLPFMLAAPFAALSCGAVALVFDQTVFRLVRRAGTLPPILLSLGLLLLLQNVVRFIWGNDVRQFRLPLLRPYELVGFNITIYGLLSILASAVFLFGLYGLLRWTQFGREVRATANNPGLSRVCGVPLERVFGGLSLLAGTAAGLGGVLLALETSLVPLLGWYSLLPIFAIAILGGLGRIAGVGLAALIVGLVTEYSLLILQSSYKSAVAFVVLSVVLIWRPTGIVAQE